MLHSPISGVTVSGAWLSGVSPRAQHRRGVVVGVQDEGGGDVGAEGVEVELHGGDHAETAAAAAERPEQVGVLVAAGGADHAVGGDDLDRAQVVAAETVGAHHHAQPAAQGEAGDTGDRHLAAGGGQPVDLGGAVDLAPGGAGLDVRGAGGGVDVHGPHGRQVDDQPVVAHGAAGDLVAAAADAGDGAVVAGDADRFDDVGHVGAAGDDGRVAVDEPVPHPAGFVVAGVVAVDDLAGQGGAQRVAHDLFGRSRHAGWSVGVCHGASVARAACTALARVGHAKMDAVGASGVGGEAAAAGAGGLARPVAADGRGRGGGGPRPEAAGPAGPARRGRGPGRADQRPLRRAVAGGAAGLGPRHVAEPRVAAAPPPRGRPRRGSRA